MTKLLLAMLALGMLVGCESQPTKPAEPEKPKAADLLTGREAFQKMFIQARHWATDAQPYLLQSQPNGDSKGHDGKSAIWRSGLPYCSRRDGLGVILAIQHWRNSASPCARSGTIS